MDYKNISVVFSESTALITINREKSLNAVNRATLEELNNAFDSIAKKRHVKAVIITGSGEKAFIAGADIGEMAHMRPLEAREFAELGLGVTRKIASMPQPVIAAVNGLAFGGGCEIALTCDFRIAAEKAKFAQPEVGLGITPGFGGTQRLPRLIGIGRASEMLLTGRVVGSDEALSMGLVNYVVPGDQLLERAMELAKIISEKGNMAVCLTKSAVQRGQSMDLERALDLEADSFALCFSTEEQKEGMEAFLSKRKPDFNGI
ncbi:enoyl-CoA hydratase-related protein [Candidatus Formimonas warabiya]|uniref:short-chain-enoyl-CoA hydratase n=1 Tax=Formimonas warabiya TaxID=1761012 RepID=A0A3G1KPQ6_FORW1|nr:enoyl-CoA hydratase-related protein [Candidatus Formimonas warabiya]ATW24449.1 crotonase [Candidatus Formimonas warabiya]